MGMADRNYEGEDIMCNDMRRGEEHAPVRQFQQRDMDRLHDTIERGLRAGLEFFGGDHPLDGVRHWRNERREARPR